jgi:hypothetical protein
MHGATIKITYSIFLITTKYRSNTDVNSVVTWRQKKCALYLTYTNLSLLISLLTLESVHVSQTQNMPAVLFECSKDL